MSFQPFAVQCLTCGSNLRVTDPAIVGTIAACPKCNSMVQIEGPHGQVAVGRSGVDSQAITEEAIAAGQAADSSSDQPSVAGPFAGAEAIDADRSAPEAAAQWQSEHTRRSRQIALVVAVSVSGLLSAVALFTWFVHTYRGQDSGPQVAASDTISAEPDPPQLPTDPSVEAIPPKDAVDSGEPSTGPLASPAETSPGNAMDSSAAAEPKSGDESIGSNDSQSNTADDDPAPVGSVKADAIPTDLMPRSPIDAVADGERAAGGQPAAENSIEGLQQLPPELEKYTKFLLTEGAGEQPTLKTPPTMDQIKIEAAAEELDDPLLAPKRKVLNLKADLAIPMALASKGYSLADLMLLVSQVTGVPIQIDWVSFDLAGIDINAPIATPKRGRSARALLDDTASALGAEIRQEESLVILTLTDESFAKTLAAITDLQDFGTTSDSAMRVLKEFLRHEEGQDARPWPIGDSREEKQLAALAVESLRRMRGIEPKVAEHRLRRWAESSEEGSIEWPLLVGGDAGPQMDEPITLAGFLRRTARRNEATCTVNWYDANRRGAAPEYLVLPHAEADAATTLAQMLSAFALQVRQVDAQHWWVGSEATYDRLPVVLWTSPLGDSRDAFIRRITSISKGGSRDAFRLAVDEQSDRALLLLPRFIAGQLPKIAASMAAN